MKYTNFDQVAILSCGFGLLLVAYKTSESLATKVVKDAGFHNLGFITLAFRYLTFSICSFFSTAIINKIGVLRNSLSLGALMFGLWIISFCLPAYYQEYIIEHGDQPTIWILNKTLISVVFIISAMVSGVGAGIVWTS